MMANKHPNLFNNYYDLNLFNKTGDDLPFLSHLRKRKLNFKSVNKGGKIELLLVLTYWLEKSMGDL